QYDKRNKNVADKVLNSEELQSINNNVEDLRSNVKLQTKKLQKLQQKLKEQQTLVRTSRELEAKFLDFKEQILQELHFASTFMSDLQLKCDLISKEFKQHQELDDDKDKKMAIISQKTENVVKQQEELSITMGNIMRKMDSL
ncbi:reticulocyte-binding protein 2 a-like isoform X3, partial [Biomphalaria pfeifferi]